MAINRVKLAGNPLRTDPTRTTGMREHFCRFIDRQFDKLKADVLRAVGKEDWLGVGQPVENANPEGHNQYTVGVHKSYFPRELHPNGIGEEYLEVHKVTAKNRQEAADKVWAEHGERLLKMMLPASRLGRKVSFYVNEPKAGVGGRLGRLRPHLVYDESKPEEGSTTNAYQSFVCNGKIGYFPSRGLIEVPDIRQPDSTSCGAAAAMSIGKYFGVGPESLSHWVSDLGTSEEGTHPEPIVKYLRGLGLQVEAFQHGNLDTLDGYLDKGWPVMCCVQDYGPKHSWEHGHYLVVIGHRDGYLFAQDPAMDNVMVDGHQEPISELGSLHKPGRVMIPEEEFLTAWHDEDEHGIPYVRFGIAVGPAVVANADVTATELRDSLGRWVHSTASVTSDGKMRIHPIVDTDAAAIHADMAEDSSVAPHVQGSIKELRDALATAEAHSSAGWGALGHVRVRNAMIRLYTEVAQHIQRNPTANTRWAFATSSGKLAAFGRWIRTRVSNLLTGRTMREAWRKYIEQGWRKGAARAFDDTTQRQKWERHPDTVGTDLYTGGREQFLRSSFNHPESVEKVKLLAARTFTDLDGVTTAMSTKMTRTLADGLTMGQHPHQIAASLAKDVDGIGRRRSILIARTELIRAHSEGQLDNLERLGIAEVGVNVEWATAGDGNVCPKCAALQGIVLKTKEAHGLIPFHPECRCAFIPSFDSPSSPEEVEAAVQIGDLDIELKGKGVFNANPYHDEKGRFATARDASDEAIQATLATQFGEDAFPNSMAGLRYGSKQSGLAEVHLNTASIHHSVASGHEVEAEEHLPSSLEHMRNIGAARLHRAAAEHHREAARHLEALAQHHIYQHANPGFDMSKKDDRLIYADWLDEHGFDKAADHLRKYSS